MVIIQLSPEELKAQIKQAVQEAVSEAMRVRSIEKADRLLTRKETATYLDVSLPTLNMWEKNKQITPTRFGNRVYFRESDLLNKVD